MGRTIARLDAHRRRSRCGRGASRDDFAFSDEDIAIGAHRDDALRAFLAVPVAAPAQAPLAALVTGLRGRVPGVRWVDTETTHITLHFFAELPGDRVSDVVAAVGGVAAAQAPFTLCAGGLGSFPGGSRARVLWLGLVQESPALVHLASGVQAAIAESGFGVDTRPFRAHITLGRPGPRFDPAAWRRELVEPVVLPPFTADQVILYESRNGHHVRERLPFGVEATMA